MVLPLTINRHGPACPGTQFSSLAKLDRPHEAGDDGRVFWGTRQKHHPNLGL